MTAVTRTAVEPLPAGSGPVPGHRILRHLARTGRLDLYGSWNEEWACRCVIEVPRPDLRCPQMEDAARRPRRVGACRARSPRLSTAV